MLIFSAVSAVQRRAGCAQLPCSPLPRHRGLARRRAWLARGWSRRAAEPPALPRWLKQSAALPAARSRRALGRSPLAARPSAAPSVPLSAIVAVWALSPRGQTRGGLVHAKSVYGGGCCSLTSLIDARLSVGAASCGCRAAAAVCLAAAAIFPAASARQVEEACIAAG